jgi:hypothetical protein
MNVDLKENNEQSPNDRRFVTVVIEEEQIEPPDDVDSSFDSLHDWLSNLCSTEKPTTKIKTYNFQISQSRDRYILSVVGSNDYSLERNHIISRIDFEPSDMFFLLPQNEYEQLDYSRAIDRVRIQLAEFTDTEVFKGSFFYLAESVNLNGEVIWTR